MAEAKKIGGVIPPTLTPFTEDGKVDTEALSALIELWTAHVDGMFICGTYGSGPLMSKEERKQVAEQVVSEADGKVAVIVHVGAADTATVVELAQHAEEIGADAVAAVPPYYYSYPEKLILDHFKALIQAVDIPVYAYNNPKVSGHTITPKMLNELAEAGLAGLKDSSFTFVTFSEFIRGVEKEGFNFIVGTEALVLPAVAIGASGTISGLANAFPEVVRELFEASKAGDVKKAAPLQQKVLTLRDILHYGPAVSATHAMLDVRGVKNGVPRRPFQPVSKEVYDKIERDLKKYLDL